ncbi:hypothetical protein [Synechococcus sp. PCC 7336]|uniref:DUF6888 family protein n=1 Tax=Synechococcus sp. PCC 7336 TaxID=195250 RepID=UPI000349F5EF|nr:hypothetical protein [Synechococcus sp. PCC 7336]
MVTPEQAIQAVVLCQWFSNGYQPINVFRFDVNLETIYIQGGVTDSMVIVIFSDGRWRFYND